VINNKLKIIANPIAGSGRAIRFLERLKTNLEAHQIKPDVRLTVCPEDACRISQEHSDDTPIICLGGDGTVNEVINGLIDNKNFNAENRPVLGVIPFGSGNVIAKELGIKRSARHFINLYQNNSVKNLDAGCVTTLKDGKKRYFISMAGAGFDAEVARQYQMNRKGANLQAHLFNYLPTALKTVWRYRMPRIRIEVDGNVLSKNASFIQAANVRSYGGPFILVDNAVNNDGLLDILWFQGIAPLDILLYYTLAFLGKTGIVKSGHIKTKKVRLSSKGKVSVQVDGDWCGYLPVEIEIIPQAIRCFTSKIQ